MQNWDKALLGFFVTKPSHRFAYLCLDNVKMYSSKKSNVRRAYYCQLIFGRGIICFTHYMVYTFFMIQLDEDKNIAR